MLYKIKPITKDESLVQDIKDCCKEMNIPFTAVSELIFENRNPHGTDRIYLTASVKGETRTRIITMFRETDRGYYIVSGSYNGETPRISKRYLTRKPENRFSKKNLAGLFSECFRRWDEIFITGGENDSNSTGD